MYSPLTGGGSIEDLDRYEKRFIEYMDGLWPQPAAKRRGRR
jgi:hypothetical protein